VKGILVKIRCLKKKLSKLNSWNCSVITNNPLFITVVKELSLLIKRKLFQMTKKKIMRSIEDSLTYILINELTYFNYLIPIIIIHLLFFFKNLFFNSLISSFFLPFFSPFSFFSSYSSGASYYFYLASIFSCLLESLLFCFFSFSIFVFASSLKKYSPVII